MQFADVDNGVGEVADTAKAALFDENEDDEDYEEEQQQDQLEDEEDEEEGVAPAATAAAEPTVDDRKAMLAKLVAKKKREAVSAQRFRLAVPAPLGPLLPYDMVRSGLCFIFVGGRG